MALPWAEGVGEVVQLVEARCHLGPNLNQAVAGLGYLDLMDYLSCPLGKLF